MKYNEQKVREERSKMGKEEKLQYLEKYGEDIKNLFGVLDYCDCAIVKLPDTSIGCRIVAQIIADQMNCRIKPSWFSKKKVRIYWIY